MYNKLISLNEILFLSTIICLLKKTESINQKFCDRLRLVSIASIIG